MHTAHCEQRSGSCRRGRPRAPPGPRSSAAESAQCRCRPHELGPAAIRPRSERPRGEAADRSRYFDSPPTHTERHTYTHARAQQKGGASDGVMAVSCGVKEHLRRLFTSNLGFDHSLRQTQRTRTWTLAAHQGGQRYQISPRPRLLPLPTHTRPHAPTHALTRAHHRKGEEATAVRLGRQLKDSHRRCGAGRSPRPPRIEVCDESIIMFSHEPKGARDSINGGAGCMPAYLG